MLNPNTYVRKPFPVDAVEVTEANFDEVAIWCGGEIREAGGKRYIKVAVRRPLNDRQTRASVGDWVLYAGNGYKVYSKTAFFGSFEKPTGQMLDRLVQERKPQPFPGEPEEMQEEVIPVSRAALQRLEERYGAVDVVVDLRESVIKS